MKLGQLQLESSVEDQVYQVYLYGRELSELPDNLPATVRMNFVCAANQLTSLRGCSNRVGQNFDCSANLLTSLEFGPAYVGGKYNCSNNELTSLKFSPRKVGFFDCSVNHSLTSIEGCPNEIGLNFWCVANGLTTLHDVHKHIISVGGNFACYNNTITSCVLGLMLIHIEGNIITTLGKSDSPGAPTQVDVILNKWKNQGRKGVLGAQRELLAAGFDELAQL